MDWPLIQKHLLNTSSCNNPSNLCCWPCSRCRRPHHLISLFKFTATFRTPNKFKKKIDHIIMLRLASSSLTRRMGNQSSSLKVLNPERQVVLNGPVVDRKMVSLVLNRVQRCFHSLPNTSLQSSSSPHENPISAKQLEQAMERKRLEQEQHRLHREQQFKDRSKQRTKEMIKWLSVFTSLFLAITLYHLNWLVSTTIIQPTMQ